MSDPEPRTLRAPDPTLTALARKDAGDTDLMLAHYDERGVPVSHLVKQDEWVIACGVTTDYATHWSVAEYARWFTVPCRECFPYAPPPGGELMGGQVAYWDDLAWQVQP